MKTKKPIQIQKSKKKKSDQFWLDAFKIKPVKVRLHRIKEETKEASTMWACLECFEFVHGSSDIVTAKSTAHNCGAIQTSIKQTNYNAFQNFTTNVSGPKSIAAISGLPTTTQAPALPPKTTTTTPPPPPPPPPPHSSSSVADYTQGQQKLTFAQLKALETKKYEVVKCNVEPQHVKKQILKAAPAQSTNSKAFISSYDKLTEELTKVLAKRGKQN